MVESSSHPKEVILDIVLLFIFIRSKIPALVSRYSERFIKGLIILILADTSLINRNILFTRTNSGSRIIINKGSRQRSWCF